MTEEGYQKMDRFIQYCVDRKICFSEDNRKVVLQAYRDFEESDK